VPRPVKALKVEDETSKFARVSLADEGADMAISASPNQDLFNPREGEVDSKQLEESVDEFIIRLPVIGSSHVGFWLWAANPYADNHTKPESQDPEFIQRAHRLLREYLELKSSVAASEPGLAPAIVTRRLKTDREKLKEEILALAKKNGVTSGKVRIYPSYVVSICTNFSRQWMLFPSEPHAEKMWRQVVNAVVTNKLGTACKIATDGDTRLICCYTNDFSDIDDVRRVVQAMADLGLTSKDAPRGIYYKCDAFTHLEIGSGNEYGIPASLYSSKDLLKSSSDEHVTKPAPNQKRKIDSFFKGSQSAAKRSKFG
jgi:hypothetical protein